MFLRDVWDSALELRRRVRSGVRPTVRRGRGGTGVEA